MSSTLSNQTFDQIAVGASCTVEHTVTRDEVNLMSLVSGDAGAYGGSGSPGDPRCEGVSAEALIHGVLKRRLPGPGTVILAHDLRYSGSARVGEVLQATVTVRDKQAPDRMVFDCAVRSKAGPLLEGTITVQAPTHLQQ